MVSKLGRKLSLQSLNTIRKSKEDQLYQKVLTRTIRVEPSTTPGQDVGLSKRSKVSKKQDMEEVFFTQTKWKSRRMRDAFKTDQFHPIKKKTRSLQGLKPMNLKVEAIKNLQSDSNRGLTSSSRSAALLIENQTERLKMIHQ